MCCFYNIRWKRVIIFRGTKFIEDVLHHCFSMQLTSQDKTPAVISRAMAKHNLEGEQAADYELVQVISEERGTILRLVCLAHFEILVLEYIICLGLCWWNANITFAILFFPLSPELVIPDNANVFYAMSTSANFDFLLRQRGSEGRPVQLRSRCSSTLPRTQQRSSLSLRLNKVTLWTLTFFWTKTGFAKRLQHVEY